MSLRKFVLLLVFPTASLAQGGPPLLTDDPSTPGEGHYEINAAIAANYRRNGQSVDAPLIDMNFGIGQRGQLKLEVPLTTESAGGSKATTGLGSILGGWKWRFLDQDKTMPVDVSIYPQVSSDALSRSRSSDAAGHDTRYLLPVEIAHRFDRLSANAELGYVLRSQSAHETFYGIAFGWNAGEQTELLAEYHRVSGNDITGSERIVNLGLRRDLGTHLKLLMAGGATPYGSSPGYTRFCMYIGLQFTN
jgi:hypothetical protein